MDAQELSFAFYFCINQQVDQAGFYVNQVDPLRLIHPTHICVDVHGCTNSASAWMRKSCYWRLFADSSNVLTMYQSRNIQQTLTALDALLQKGTSLADAIETLHIVQNIPFDDIWPASMLHCQLSEKEAMQFTKNHCGFWKHR